MHSAARDVAPCSWSRILRSHTDTQPGAARLCRLSWCSLHGLAHWAFSLHRAAVQAPSQPQDGAGQQGDTDMAPADENMENDENAPQGIFSLKVPPLSHKRSLEPEQCAK